jgi:TatD DNase family protein
MKIKYIDTHSHLNIEPLLDNIEEHIQELIKNNVFTNVIGVDLDSSRKAIELAQKYPQNVIASVGIHPEEANKFTSNDLVELEEIIKNNLEYISCIGECGLDYFYPEYNKEKQKELFYLQIELAKKYKKPLMLHIREAHSDNIEILKKINYKDIIIHCFSDGAEFVEEYNKLNCYISISGIVTFKNSLLLKEAVKKIPLNKLLTETDAPFLAPMPFRGKTNQPIYVIHINNYLSELLELKTEDFNEQILKNAKKILVLVK